jgi:NAD(P)-dependent dehydrogenase (short-subunit alcohol dehydrogenase family)
LGSAWLTLLRGLAVPSRWGRNLEKNVRASARLRAHGGAVDARLCDVSDRKAVEGTFAATLAEFGRIDACFANAGIGGGGRKSFVDRSEEEWRRMFAVNLDSVFRLFQFAARHMMDRAASGDAFGRLVATSSTASIFGTARNEHNADGRRGSALLLDPHQSAALSSGAQGHFGSPINGGGP